MEERILKSKCTVFGHRNTILNDDKYAQLKIIIENLIVSCNVDTFLFGSRSNFDKICYKIVSELKLKYPFIKRKKYTCASETCILECDKEKWESIYEKLGFDKNNISVYDEEVHFKDRLIAGEISYIKRNNEMIDNSDICIFYYDENYKPNKTKKQNSKSGTKIAYEYAKRKNKRIINVK